MANDSWTEKPDPFQNFGRPPSDTFPTAEGDSTWYYPTLNGIHALQRLGPSVGGEIGLDVYAFNELMSKPWTKSDYLHEVEAPFSITARVWAMSLANRYISNSPRDNFYGKHATDPEGRIREPNSEGRPFSDYPEGDSRRVGAQDEGDIRSYKDSWQQGR